MALLVDDVGVVGDVVADHRAELGEFLLGPHELVVGIQPLHLVAEDRVQLPVVDVTSFLVLSEVDRLPCHDTYVPRRPA